MVDGGGLENRWVKASRVRILLPPPKHLGHVLTLHNDLALLMVNL